MHVHLFITKPEMTRTMTMTHECRVGILLRNLVFLIPMFPCRLQRMALGNVIIYVEFLVWHQHFDSMPNASLLTAHSAERVYVFHGCQFPSPVMSPFFHPHEPYEDITLDDVRPPFLSPMQPTDREDKSNTRLTLTYSLSSSSETSREPPPRHGRGFICT